MKTLIAILAIAVVLFGVTTVTARTDDKTFLLDPITYPDGMKGIAEVVVSQTDVPLVTVHYYSEDRVEYLGKYEDYSGGDIPFDLDQAREFAFNHFFDKW